MKFSVVIINDKSQSVRINSILNEKSVIILHIYNVIKLKKNKESNRELLFIFITAALILQIIFLYNLLNFF